MLQSIPALPVGDIKKSIGFYCDKLGFTLVHHEDGFAVLMCNEVRIHLWEASDEGWRSRSNDSPVYTNKNYPININDTKNKFEELVFLGAPTLSLIDF